MNEKRNPQDGGEVDNLIRTSRSPDWSVREQACLDMSGHLSNPNVVRRITELLDDPDIAVQVTAAHVLARRGGNPGLTAVLDTLGRRIDDPDADHIAYKLQELQGLEELPFLERARSILTATRSDTVRLGVAEIEKLFGHYA